MSNNDLISREALKKAITLNRNIDRNAVCDVLDVIDNAPTVEGKLSDKQIEKITDLLETEWGYEGIREDITRILKGGAE